MKFFLHLLMAILLLPIGMTKADDSLKSKNLGNGWSGLTQQLDPFDKSRIEIVQISKGNFTFRCDELNMEVSSYGFESLSFDADLSYMINNQAPVEKVGKYSTYLGGSDLVTDSRYFSFNLSSTDIDALKAGTSIKVAGNYSIGGWQTKKLNLTGFASAYNKMCQ